MSDGRTDAREPLTYRQAGVDIDAGNDAVQRIRRLVGAVQSPAVLTDIGSFSGLYRPDLSGMEEPVLAAGADGVGTKLRIAFMMDRHDTVGIDCVAMNVNDLLPCGARPLFFLDTLATGALAPEVVADVVAGVVEGCRRGQVVLLGGETAEMPDAYPPGEYDLSGFAVGLVDRSAIIDGSRIRPGDVVLGLGSSGLHSNGYSLVRMIFFKRLGWDVDRHVPQLGRTLGEELLEPTLLYTEAVQAALAEAWDQVHGMANITGGGMPDNGTRILPSDCDLEIDADSWEMPAIFPLLAELGPVARDEMLRTFNCGIGYIMIVAPGAAERLQNTVRGTGLDVWQIGVVREGSGQCRISGGPWPEG